MLLGKNQFARFGGAILLVAQGDATPALVVGEKFRTNNASSPVVEKGGAVHVFGQGPFFTRVEEHVGAAPMVQIALV
jgi:hypothetical protein